MRSEHAQKQTSRCRLRDNSNEHSRQILSAVIMKGWSSTRSGSLLQHVSWPAPVFALLLSKSGRTLLQIQDGCSALTLRRIRAPPAPARTEAPRMPIFDMSSWAPSPNASPAINNDMVKPMPHSQLAPIICFQLTPAGAAAIFNFVASQAAAVMPIGLLANSPSATPRATG